MKRPWLILCGGLLLALLGYGAMLLARAPHTATAHQGGAPELAWLKTEFKIPDAEFQRIEKLHSSYVAGCMERCRLIDAKNAELQRLLQESKTVTPQVDQAIQDAARLRADCQAEMLRHFYEVRASMPPEQGQRYFDWVVRCTFGSEHASMMSAPANAHHEHHAK